MKATAPACGFSADTEILTRRGWIFFDELGYCDEVATRTEGGQFEWRFPRRIIRQHYDGQMLRLHSRSLDMLVAPGHPVPWSPEGGSRNLVRISEANALLSRARFVAHSNAVGSLQATSTWDAPELAEKIFPGVRRTRMGPAPRDLRMTGDQFAAFMGMFTAEGSTTPTTEGDWLTAIAQEKHGKGYEEYRALLTEIYGREPGRGGHQWRLYSRPLYEYLAPLGKARSKWVPQEILNLSRRQLEIFWRYYFLGDGSYERHADHKRIADAECASTTSAVLAGQLQEVVQKLGYSCSVRACKSKANYLVRTESLIYKIRVRRTLYPQFSVTEVPYSGMTGCVQVPNPAVYVRRNGHPAWSGSV